MENKETTETEYKVICWYWNKHDLKYWKYKCDCKNKYWFSEIDLKIRAWKNNKSMYMQDLTENDKRLCWKALKEKWVI